MNPYLRAMPGIITIINVQSILIAERDLNPELKARAKLLNIKFKCVSVNKK